MRDLDELRSKRKIPEDREELIVNYIRERYLLDQCTLSRLGKELEEEFALQLDKSNICRIARGFSYKHIAHSDRLERAIQAKREERATG